MVEVDDGSFDNNSADVGVDGVNPAVGLPVGATIAGDAGVNVGGYGVGSS